MRTIQDMIDSCPDLAELDQQSAEFMLNARATADFYFFCKHILGLHLMDEFHKDLIDFVLKDPSQKRYALIVPRQHSKTTLFSVALPIWIMFTRRKQNMMLTSSSLEQQSKKIMERVQEMIIDNEMLRTLIPSDRYTVWNKYDISTTTGCKYATLPFSDSIRGGSYDWVFCDDILRDTNMSHDRIKELFWGVIYPTTSATKGSIVLVGTPMTAYDLFVDIQQKGNFPVIKKQAVSVDAKGEWQTPLWGKNYSLDELQQMKEDMGSMQWSREMMCNPLSTEDKIFPYDTVILPNISQEDELLTPRLKCNYYAGVDVALSKSSTADFTAISIMERNAKGELTQVRLEKYKGWSVEQIIDRLNTLHDTFSFSTLLVEEMGLSIGMVKTLMDPELHPEISRVTEGFITTHKSKERIMSKLQAALERRQLKLINNNELHSQLDNFGMVLKKDARGDTKTTYESIGSHDDLAIATMLCYEAAGQPMAPLFVASSKSLFHKA